MRTVAILNLKGGVGKTITAVNMAALLAAEYKIRVTVDADPQDNATRFFGGNTEAGGLTEFLEGFGDCYAGI